MYRSTLFLAALLLSAVAASEPNNNLRRKLQDDAKKTNPNDAIASRTRTIDTNLSNGLNTDTTGTTADTTTDTGSTKKANPNDATAGRTHRTDDTKKDNPNDAPSGRDHTVTPNDGTNAYTDDAEYLIVKCEPGQGDAGCLADIVATASQTQSLLGSVVVDPLSTDPVPKSVDITQPLDTLDFVAIRIDNATIASRVKQVLLSKPNVVSIEPEPTRNFTMITEGEFAPRRASRRLAGRQQPGYGVANSHAMNAWAIHGNQIKGAGVTVCVIDSGLVNHRDIDDDRIDGSNDPSLFVPWDADGIGHGSHVAGIIGAADNYGGMVGVAPDANVYVARVFDSNGNYRSGGVLAAVVECKKAGAKVINMSLGGTGSSTAEEQVFSDLYFRDGIVVVAASGNDGNSHNLPLFPAYYPTVISVGATNVDDKIASFSTHNDRVDISAPGVGIYSLDNDGKGYRFASGTSMACPHVAGVAALLFAAKPTATPQEIRASIEQSAHDLGTFGKDNFYGWGLVRADDAIELLLEGVATTTQSPTPVPVPTAAPTQNPTVEFDASSGCNAGQTAFSMLASVDEFAVTEQTTVVLEDILQNPIFSYSPMANNQELTENRCLSSSSCYTLKASDNGFDGTGKQFRVAVNGDTVYNPDKGDFQNRYITSFGSSCSSCINFQVIMNSGDWASFDDTRYSLVEIAPGGTTTVFSQSNMSDNTVYNSAACLELTKCYKFKIEDAIGDGVAGGDGAFALRYDGNVFYEPAGGDFKFIHEINFGTCV